MQSSTISTISAQPGRYTVTLIIFNNSPTEILCYRYYRSESEFKRLEGEVPQGEWLKFQFYLHTRSKLYHTLELRPKHELDEIPSKPIGKASIVVSKRRF